MFENIPPGPEDPMFHLKVKAEADNSPEKVDIGVGIYRDEAGKYSELRVVKEAKKRLDQLNLGHDYGLTTGDSEFLKLAAGVLFGEQASTLLNGQISSVQTLSGSGANHLGAMLLAQSISPKPRVYVGVPTWSNTIPIFEYVGLEIATYNYIDPITRQVDLAACLEAIWTAPRGSVFAFQGCCHNPTGADLTIKQWDIITEEIKAHDHLPFLDFAYQGLGDGLDEDAAGVRSFANAGIDMIVCQSFAKNFALYGERCGALHVVAKSAQTAANVKDQLRSLIRREYSSSPAYGARLVKIILSDLQLREEWYQELAVIRDRLQRNRVLLCKELTEILDTPGDWKHIVEDKGLFTCLSLTRVQCLALVDEHHIHLPLSGRINVAGLNLENIERTAKAIDKVVRR